MDKKHGKTRSDHPSGRQTMEQSENGSGRAPARSSLHQGQGPDFQTQDDAMEEKNPGIEQLYRNTRGPHQQPFNDPLGVEDETIKDKEE